MPKFDISERLIHILAYINRNAKVDINSYLQGHALRVIKGHICHSSRTISY